VPRRHDIVQRTQAGVELNILKGARQAQLCRPVRPDASYAPPLKINLPLLRLVEAIDAVQQTGLAGTVGADMARISFSRTSRLTSTSALTPPKERERLSIFILTLFSLLSRAIFLSRISLFRRFCFLGKQPLPVLHHARTLKAGALQLPAQSPTFLFQQGSRVPFGIAAPVKAGAAHCAVPLHDDGYLIVNIFAVDSCCRYLPVCHGGIVSLPSNAINITIIQS